MGIDCSAPSRRYDQLYLPADTFRLCNPSHCFCNTPHRSSHRHGGQRSSKYVYYERNSSGREKYYDPMEFMERMREKMGQNGISSGNGGTGNSDGWNNGGGYGDPNANGGASMWPGNWKSPRDWTSRDYDVLTEILRECYTREMGRNRGPIGPTWPEAMGGHGGFAWGGNGGPSWSRGNDDYQPQRRPRERDDRCDRMEEQMQQLWEVLFGSSADMLNQRYQAHLSKQFNAMSQGGGGMGGINGMNGMGGMGGMGTGMPGMGMSGMGGGMPYPMAAAMMAQVQHNANMSDPGAMGEPTGGGRRTGFSRQRPWRGLGIGDDEDEADFGGGGYRNPRRRRRQNRFGDDDERFFGGMGGDGPNFPRRPMPGPRRPRPGEDGIGNTGPAFSGGSMFDFTRAAQEPLRPAPMADAAPPSRRASPEPARRESTPRQAAPTRPPERVVTPMGPGSPLPVPGDPLAGRPMPRWPPSDGQEWPPPGAIPINPGVRGQQYPLPRDAGERPLYREAYAREDLAARPGWDPRFDSLKPDIGTARPQEDGPGRDERQDGRFNDGRDVS